MRTRKLIRDTATRGATVRAIVESRALGYATVRLVRNGARLTNLPAMGQNIKPGDTVIVDYSGEGRPIVRPLTVFPTVGTEPDLEIAPRVVHPEPEEEVPEDQPTDNTWYPIVGRYTNTSATYGTISPLTRALYFPDCIFATYPNWLTNGNTWNPQIPGTYAIRMTVGFECDSFEFESHGLRMYWHGASWSDYYDDSNMFRMGYNQESPVVVTATGLHKVPVGATAYEEMYLLPTMRREPSAGRWPDLLYAPGKYPIFEYWMVAPITSKPSSSNTSWPWWYWL